MTAARAARLRGAASALAALLAASACATPRGATPARAEPLADLAAERPPADEDVAPEDASPAQAPEPVVVAWAPPSFHARGAGPDASDARLRGRIVRAARALLGKRLKTDCSGFVLRVLRDAHLEVRLAPARSRSESLFRASREIDAPRPGDLAFFHDTYDRNRDRRANDRFTHVGLVEEVDGSAVVLIHRAARGIERLRMDLLRPDDPDANDRVRFERRGDAPGTRYLAGELFAAFGELLGGEFTRMLQASRTPGTSRRHPVRR